MLTPGAASGAARQRGSRVGRICGRAQGTGQAAAMSRLERELIVKALDQTSSNVMHAARLLKIFAQRFATQDEGSSVCASATSARSRERSAQRRDLRVRRAVFELPRTSARAPTRACAEEARRARPSRCPRCRPSRVRAWSGSRSGPPLAGTPEGSLPRVADEEMPGEQASSSRVVDIDVFPYPNEEAAIPLTNVGLRRRACAVHRAR